MNLINTTRQPNNELLFIFPSPTSFGSNDSMVIIAAEGDVAVGSYIYKVNVSLMLIEAKYKVIASSAPEFIVRDIDTNEVYADGDTLHFAQHPGNGIWLYGGITIETSLSWGFTLTDVDDLHDSDTPNAWVIVPGDSTTGNIVFYVLGTNAVIMTLNTKKGP
jgi:hypothetical protein